MVSRQEVSRVIPFCANRQNGSGIIESLTPACVVRHYNNKSLKHGHSFLNILHSLLRVVKIKFSGFSIRHSCAPGGSLVLRKLVSDYVIKVQHLDIDFSSLESPDDIALPCKEPVAVVELGLRSMLSRWTP